MPLNSPAKVKAPCPLSSSFDIIYIYRWAFYKYAVGHDVRSCPSADV